MASWRRTPVIRSAARLKVVMCHSESTVKTPSLIESRIGSLVTPKCNYHLMQFARAPWPESGILHGLEGHAWPNFERR